MDDKSIFSDDEHTPLTAKNPMVRQAASMLLIAAVCVASYFIIYHSPFVYDDKDFIQNAAAYNRPITTDELFTKQYYAAFGERTYRPVNSLSFFIDSDLWNLSSEGTHVVSILLHILISLVVFGLLLAMVKSNAAALFGAALFAAHPIHVEAVALGSNREELLCALFYFCSYYIYVLWRRKNRGTPQFLFVFSISFLMAIFSKEMAAGLPAVLLLHEFVFREKDVSFKSAVRRALPFLAASTVIIGFFLFLRYGWLRNETGEVSYPGGGPWFAFLTMSRAFFIYIKLLIAPFSLCAQHIVPDATRFLSVYGLAAVSLVALITAALAICRRLPLAAFPILFFFVSFLPVSNIIPFGEIMAERYAYIPSFGMCALAAWIFLNMQPSIAKTAPLALIVPVFICLSLARSAVWGGDMLLWSNTVKCAPSSSAGHENLGNAYAARGEYGKALKEYTSASKCPDIKELQKLEYNRGLVFKSIGRYKDAEDSFFNALRLDPSYAQPHFSLGAIAEMRGNYTLAQFHFQRAIEKEPQNALAYYIAGRQRFIHAAGRDDQRQAFLLLSRSVGLNPLDANAHAALGAVMINLGDRRGALHELESALTLDPVNVPALQLMRKYHVSAEHKTIYYTLYAHSNWYAWLTLFLIIFLSLSAVFYIRYLIIINE